MTGFILKLAALWLLAVAAVFAVDRLLTGFLAWAYWLEPETDSVRAGIGALILLELPLVTAGLVVWLRDNERS